MQRTENHPTYPTYEQQMNGGIPVNEPKPKIPEPKPGDLVGYRGKKPGSELRTYRVQQLDGQGEELTHVQLYGPPSFLFWVRYTDLEAAPTERLMSQRRGR